MMMSIGQPTNNQLTQEEINARLKILADQQQATRNQVMNSYNNQGYQNAQWRAQASTATQRYLEDKEREAIQLMEREACAQLVADMAEELGCPNLLHGVCLAIKARRT